jgi:large subunit ribosomal protein L14
MIYVQTYLKTLDNSGARFVQCVKVLNKSMRVGASAGQTIVVSIREIIPRIVYNKKKHLKKKKTLQKGEVHRSVVVCCAKKVVRGGWQYLSFSKSTVVVITKQSVPSGSRVLGPIFEEVRSKQHMQLASLANYTI